MEKIKVLAIAPYPGLEKLILSVGAQFPELDVTARAGDLEVGLHAAMDLQGEKYDFILTRGGTAEIIAASSPVPVIRVPISGYDFVRAVKLARIYSDKAAVVGFPDITDGAAAAKELLDSGLDIFTIHSGAECEAVILKLKNEGYRIVLGDAVTQRVAVKHGLNAVMITSGSESVHDALNHIINISKISNNYMRENRMLQALVENCGSYCAVFSSEGKKLFSDLPPELDSANEIIWLGKPESESRLSVFKLGGRNWQARSVPVPGGPDGGLRIVYCRELDFGGGPEPAGISVHNLEYHQVHLLEQLNLFSSETLRRSYMLAEAGIPVLIVGEPGTGKNTMAHILHLNGPHSKNPFVQVDCRLVDAASFHDLLSGKLYPAAGGEAAKSTLFLKALDRLPQPLQNELCSALESGDPFAGYTVIASAYTDLDELALAKRFSRDVLDIIAFSHLRIPPLRERAGDLAGMFGLLINRNNERYGKQLTGIAPEAAEMILSYSWPGNINQLFQVFDEMAMLSDGPMIGVSAAEAALKRQHEKRAEASCIYCIPEGRTLDGITEDIIRIVLENEGGNQSAAAARLGIGRSTLWRKLKGGAQPDQG